MWVLLACAAPGTDTGAGVDPAAPPTVDGVAYDSVQDAVDAAPTGGTVRLPGRSFYESIVVTGRVTIEGGGAEHTRIRASSGSAIRVESGADLTLRGLTVSGGDGEVANDEDTWGGGLYVQGSLYAEDVVVEDNQATIGGGLVLFSDDWSEEGSNLVDLVRCVVRDNTAHFGAAIYVAGPRRVRIVDTDIVSNTSDDGGGWYDDSAAIDFWGPLLTLEGSRVGGNQGGCGGLSLGDGTTTVTDSVVTYNSGEAADGACLEPFETEWPRLSSAGSDWGEDTGERDVVVYSQSWSYGANATFDCDLYGCR